MDVVVRDQTAEVGTTTTHTVNIIISKEAGVSPLMMSAGWVLTTASIFNINLIRGPTDCSEQKKSAVS